MNFLLQTTDRKDRKPNFVIIVIWIALIVGGWVGGVGVEQRSSLAPAEIAFYVFLLSFNDGRFRVSPRFYLFVFEVNQRNEEEVWADIFERTYESFVDTPKPWINFCFKI